jgi:hypothetical protein
LAIRNTTNWLVEFNEELFENLKVSWSVKIDFKESVWEGAWKGLIWIRTGACGELLPTWY